MKGDADVRMKNHNFRFLGFWRLSKTEIITISVL